MTIFHRLPLTTRLIALLTLALLPIGLALMLLTARNLDNARDEGIENAHQAASTGAMAIESEIARTILATRLAANASVRNGDPCGEMSRTLDIAPGLARQFALADAGGRTLCATAGFPAPTLGAIAPGATGMELTADGRLALLVGVVGGGATVLVDTATMRRAYVTGDPEARHVRVSDGQREVELVSRQPAGNRHFTHVRQPIAGGRLAVEVDEPLPALTLVDRASLALPLIMWVLAGIISWILMHSLVSTPLVRLRRAVAAHQPGETFVAPDRLGSTAEIRELSEAFARTVARIDESDREMAVALEGQRRLVREVHHRVKNNLQVIASLLSIQGRAAGTPEAKAAYSAIGRRVDALAVVHRNHFAEVEENRGIALRPMLTELASGLRATAPDRARGVSVALHLDPASTTQDAAVAAAFFVTELAEFAMLHGPADGTIEIDLRRSSELTATLSVGSAVLVEGDDSPEWAQFERIVQGLSRQLRSPVEKKIGRYDVDIPVFPA